VAPAAIQPDWPAESGARPQAAPAVEAKRSERIFGTPLVNFLADDRDHMGPADKTILIIEDDRDFAATLQSFCRDKGFMTVVALTGEDGLKLARTYAFKAIILDIHLPGIDGWAVLEALKENPATRHIPVHFMSADDPVPQVFTKGAIGYLKKPVNPEDLEMVMANLKAMIDKKMKDVLLVEDNSNQRQAIIKLIGDHDVVIREASSGKEAIAILRKNHFDCMILDLGLPDMSGFDLLKKMDTDDRVTPPPVVIYTGRELTSKEDSELRKYSGSIIIKGARSAERLLDETSLFLHQVVEKMPEEKRKMITGLHDLDQMFSDRTILIVDDDMRNVFALSKALQSRGIKTLKAENGLRALEILEQSHSVDLILMDIMMPVMDGYETMQKIRAQSKFNKLPIIALTAKAMARDKDDCITAGANDYLAKPVDMDRLMSMMRVWLYR
jgi:CheY-like chemotaxis protein